MVRSDSYCMLTIHIVRSEIGIFKAAPTPSVHQDPNTLVLPVPHEARSGNTIARCHAVAPQDARTPPSSDESIPRLSNTRR